MNRSILIIICDFLLVSLLVFSTPDIKKVGENSLQQDVRLTTRTNRVNAGEDLGQVMKQALEEEQETREALLAELASTRETAEQRQALLTERQALLDERAEQLQTAQGKLESQEQERLRLQQQQQQVRQQFSAAQTNIQSLTQELRTRSTESLMSKEQLAAAADELRKRAEEAAALEQRLAQLAQSNQIVLKEKQQLAIQLQVAEVEKRHATEQVLTMREQVQVERAEKARLAEGVQALASSSSQLAQEIRQDRSLAPNTIFNEFLTNRVHAQLIGVRAAVFGDTAKNSETKTVLATDGANTFALCHVEETPFTFWDPGTDWKELRGALGRDVLQFPIESLSFNFRDPRLVLIPVQQAEISKLGCKAYDIETDPYKFQEAVVVGASDGYYGECRFEIDPDTPGYLKLDRNFVKGLFGKFNPSRGDLVFSRTGGLLGMMANNTYCLRIQDFETVATLKLGQQAPDQHTGDTLSALYWFVSRMHPQLR